MGGMKLGGMVAIVNITMMAAFPFCTDYFVTSECRITLAI